MSHLRSFFFFWFRFDSRLILKIFRILLRYISKSTATEASEVKHNLQLHYLINCTEMLLDILYWCFIKEVQNYDCIDLDVGDGDDDLTAPLLAFAQLTTIVGVETPLLHYHQPSHSTQGQPDKPCSNRNQNSVANSIIYFSIQNINKSTLLLAKAQLRGRYNLSGGPRDLAWTLERANSQGFLLHSWKIRWPGVW